MTEVTLFPAGHAEIVGDHPDRRVEILSEAAARRAVFDQRV